MATVSNQHPFSAPSETPAPVGGEARGRRDAQPGDSVWPVLLRLADVSQANQNIEQPLSAAARASSATTSESEFLSPGEPGLPASGGTAEPPLIHISRWSLSAGLAEDQPSPASLAAEEAAPDQPDSHQSRKDKLARLRVHQRLRQRALSWIPTVPPTLLLGLLICAGALLMGILFRFEKRSESKAVSPVETIPAEGEEQPSEVAAMPNLTASPAAAASQPSKTAAKSMKKTASNKKPVAAKPQLQPAANAQPPAVAGQPARTPLPVEAGTAPTDPSATPPGMQHAQAPAREPEYQARRPVAEFRGIITKPDGASTYERY